MNSTSGSYVYLVAKIIAACLNLLSIAIFTRLLDVELYGKYLLFVSYVTLICSLFFWWHRLSAYRYFYKYGKNINTYLKTSIILFLWISIFLIFLNTIFSLTAFSTPIKLLFFLCIIGAIIKSNFELNQSILNISGSGGEYGANIIIKSLSFIIIGSLIIYNFNLEENGLIIAFIISFLIGSLFSNWNIYKGCLQGEFSKNIFKKYRSYGFPMVGLFLFDYIITFFDRLCLNYYLGESAVGIYGANYDLIKQILIFFMAIQSIVVYPHINRAYEDGEKGHFNRLLTFNLNVLFMVFIPLSIIIIYFNPLISELFIGDKFRVNSPQLIPVFATIFFIWGCKIYHFDYFFQLKEKMHYPMFILGFGSIINVGLNIYLIPIIGILGAAYATLIVYASIFIISVIVANYLIQIDYQLIVVIKVIIFLLIALFTINIPFISQVHGILKIIIFMLIYSSLTLKYNFTKIAPLLREIL